MPVHDWTRVDAGLFHAFHFSWIVRLCEVLNGACLPSDYYAVPEPSQVRSIPGSFNEDLPPVEGVGSAGSPALHVAIAPPRARVVRSIERGTYARRADRIAVKHRHGQIVAVIEIVSPGNKNSGAGLREFVVKVSDRIQQGVNVLVIDPFPPGPRDPHGIHKAIWDEFEIEDYEPPPGQTLTVAAYSAGEAATA